MIAEQAPQKKKSGCSCLAIGCFALLAMILVPIVGGFVALSMLGDEFYGEKLMMVLKYPAFVEGVKEAVEENKEISKKEKKLLLNFYDQLVSEYDKLPAEKQQVIHKNLIVVIRKAATNPKLFEKEPPPEFNLIIQTLGYPELDLDMLKKEMEQLKDQNTKPETASPPNDPASTIQKYDF